MATNRGPEDAGDPAWGPQLRQLIHDTQETYRLERAYHPDEPRLPEDIAAFMVPPPPQLTRLLAENPALWTRPVEDVPYPQRSRAWQAVHAVLVAALYAPAAGDPAPL